MSSKCLKCLLVWVCCLLPSDCVEWYLRGGPRNCTTPWISIYDALDDGSVRELEEVLHEHSVGGEYWFGVDDEPRDIFEEAVHKLMVLDLDTVLPPQIASRVAGVSWRVNRVHALRDHDFHFDSDEGTMYSIPGIPIVHPLLSTVTYLSSRGGPTMLLNYTMLDSNGPKLPQEGWLSMPHAGKHLAFDPRLYHGVVSALRQRYDSWFDFFYNFMGLNDVRLVLGLNFWEMQSQETLLYNYSAYFVRNKSGGGCHVSQKSQPSVRLDCGMKDDSVHVIRSRPHDGFAEESFIVPLDSGGIGRDFKQHRHPLKLELRILSSVLLDLERESRGSTVRFELTEDAVNLTYLVPHDASMSLPQNRHKDAERIAKDMLATRCQLFQPGASTMNPPLASKYCEHFMSAGNL